MKISSLLGHAQELLALVLQSERPADTLMDTFFRSHKYLGSHDRRFIAETVYGTLRHLRFLNAHLEHTLKAEYEEVLEHDRTVLLAAAYTALYFSQARLAIDDVLPLLKSPKTKAKLTEVFDAMGQRTEYTAESDVERIGVRHSFPDWMVQRFLAEYGAETTEQLCASLNIPAPLTIRVNTLKSDRDGCRAELAKQEIETTPTERSPIGLQVRRRMNVFALSAFQSGFFEVQDEGSQLLPLLIDPKPNAKVLDACAGAGGKTLELSALMGNRGEIFAVDINSFRLEELRKRGKRAGVQNIRIKLVESLCDLHEKYAGFFDVVFIDAPCSGLGTIRRNPGMKWMVTEQTVREIAEKQSAILDASVPLVKVGGKFVYATCTMLKQENQEQIDAFLARHPDFRYAHGTELSEFWRNMFGDAEGPVQFFPHLHGTDGFFCAMLIRH